MQENHNSSNSQINDEDNSSGFSEPMDGHESSPGNAEEEELDQMSIQIQEQQVMREQIGEAME